MGMVLRLSLRNIRVYVRDRASVFFSLLSVLIIIGLYALFLGRVQTNGIRSAAGSLPGIRWLVDSWIIAGLLSVNSVTVSLGVLGTMVFDKEYKRLSDFIVAPASRTGIVVSYLIAALAIGLAFSLIAFAAGEVYIVTAGGALLSAVSLLRVIGLLALSVLSSSSVMFLLASFLSTGSAFGVLSTLLGTLIGFVTGVYVPIGVLPDAVQRVVALVPFSHSAALLRQELCRGPMSLVFAGAPPEAQARYLKMYGVTLFWGGTEITAAVMLGILAGVVVVFLGLSALKLRRYGKG